MTLQEFKNYVLNEAKKLYQIEILKEEKYKLERELAVLSENDSAEATINAMDPETLKKIRQEMIKKAAGWDFSEPSKIIAEKKYSDKASNFIGDEIGHLQKDKGYKHDRAVAAAINIAKDKGYKIPKKTNESEAPSAGLSNKKKSSIVKKARAGEDIGHKGKGFKDIEDKAAKKYGSKEKGEKVAAAVLWKNIKRK